MNHLLSSPKIRQWKVNRAVAASHVESLPRRGVDSDCEAKGITDLITADRTWSW